MAKPAQNLEDALIGGPGERDDDLIDLLLPHIIGQPVAVA
jgi:hypothetical protein